MACDEFFVMCERFQNNFRRFYEKVPHQPIFLTPLAQNFGFFGLCCMTATICKLKNLLGRWVLKLHTVRKTFERNQAIGSKVMSKKVLNL